jgi:hypothetical protein
MVRRIKAKRLDLEKYVRNQHLFWALVLLVIFLLTAFFARNGYSQDAAKKYDTLPIHEDFIIPTGPNVSRNQVRQREQNIRQQVLLARGVVRGELDLGSNQAAFKKYMAEYFLPLMTQYDEDNLGKLGVRREDLFKDYVSRANGQVRQYLIDSLVWPFAQAVAEGNYHPAARMNAVYIMGRLNDVETGSGGLPVPSAKAFDYLKNLVANESAKPYLRVGAMVGLVRHAEIEGIKSKGQLNAQMTDLANKMIAVLNADFDAAKEPEKLWMKRRAVQILGGLRARGEANSIENALRLAISNKQLDTWTRYDAMVAFRDLAFPDNADVRAAETAKEMAQFVADYLRSEAKHIEMLVGEYVDTEMIYEKGGVGSTDTKSGSDDGSGGLKGDAANRGAAGQGIQRGDPGDGGSGKGAETGEKSIDRDLPEYHLNAIKERMMIVLDTAQLSIQGKENVRGTRVWGMAQRVPAAETAKKVEVTKWGTEIDSLKTRLNTQQQALPRDQFTLATGAQADLSKTAQLRMELLKAASQIEAMIADKKKEDSTEAFK